MDLSRSPSMSRSWGPCLGFSKSNSNMAPLLCALSNNRDEFRLKIFVLCISATASTFSQLSSSPLSTLTTIVLTLKVVIIVVVELN